MLLITLLALLQDWAPVFDQQRSCTRAISLALGLLCGLGRRTVTRAICFNPSFPTQGVDDPRSRSRTTSWSKGLPYKRDVLGLAQKLSARADSGRRLGRQGELELFEQQLVVGLRVSVAA